MIRGPINTSGSLGSPALSALTFAAKVTLGGKQVDGYVIGLELTYADGRKEIRELMFAAANGKVVKA